ncbi:rna-directed dna polymerase from mobile element jockey- hypothetical protein [Limosa lapponica baueri]|uniref:Uncharacterized protein n=1 Tax=Limosa lapponica baueri TaxID=1758121 RepID=A0A2I0U5X2_LIMLA|nr:rna-directed dna polymerase from mobile element jockey- hypothetical protein [Limosa lapponica baueri]
MEGFFLLGPDICEHKKVIVSSLHGFMKAKLCLTNLIAFYDDMTGLVDERRAKTVDYIDFRKAFDAVSHNILTDELMKYRLDKWTVRWTETWLNCWAQRDPAGGEVHKVLHFRKRNCKVLHLERNNPMHQYRLEPTIPKTVLQKRTSGALWTPS